MNFTDCGQQFTFENDRIIFASEGGPNDYVCVRAG